MHYLNLGILIGLVGLIIGFYVHTDKKIDRLSDEIKSVHKELSDEIKSNHKDVSDRIERLSDRMDRLYDIQVHAGMGLRPMEHTKDKAANE
jgi:transcriptional regulatory protein LevR